MPQITVASVLTLCIVVYFWVESRYSSLLRKLHNGKGIHVAALSFEALVPVTPQMLVATRIGQGAVLVELLPAKDLPSKIMLLGIVLVGIVGTFLPVPIALFLPLKRGVLMPYVVTLPCTLGAFSGYSLLILGRTISWRTAFEVHAAVVAVGALARIGKALVQHSL